MAENQFNYFSGGEKSIPSGVVNLDMYYEHITGEFWQTAVLEYRAWLESNPEPPAPPKPWPNKSSRDEYDTWASQPHVAEYLKWRDEKSRRKLSFGGYSISGTFNPRRRISDLAEHSGLIALDIDEQDNELGLDVDGIRGWKFTRMMHKSVGGAGWVVIVAIDPVRHNDAFQSLELVMANQFRATIDKSCKDVSRFRFGSYDPDAFYNPDSTRWTTYVPKREQKKRKVNPKTNWVYTNDDLDFIIAHIAENRINIAEEYDVWRDIGFALSTLGERGRQMFHVVSSQSGKYDAGYTDKFFDIALKRGMGGVTMGTFFHHCQLHGIPIHSPDTRAIINMAVMRRAGAYRNGEFGENGERMRTVAEQFMGVLESHGIDTKPHHVDLVMSVFQTDPELLGGGNKTGDATQYCRGYLSQLNLRFNELTENWEWDGDIVIENDRHWYTLYLDARAAVFDLTKTARRKGDILSQTDFAATMKSSLFPSFHPAHEFFRKHGDMSASGAIAEVVDCFTFEHMGTFRYQNTDIEMTPDRVKRHYFTPLFTKWLMGAVALWHGNMADLMLVLMGEQNIGKTVFFRHLLPKTLRKYYSERMLDNTRDLALIMSERLVIMFDEMHGRDKSNAKFLKRMLSSHEIDERAMFGRKTQTRRRTAMMAATTNDSQILNDMTGNRRVIPVPVAAVDLDKYIAIDKNRLWAEAYQLFEKSDDRAWLLTRDEIEMLQFLTTDFEESDPLLEAIAQCFGLPQPDESGAFPRNARWLSSVQIAQTCRIHAGFDPMRGGMNLENAQHFSKAMHKLGWSKQGGTIKQKKANKTDVAQSGGAMKQGYQYAVYLVEQRVFHTANANPYSEGSHPTPKPTPNKRLKTNWLGAIGVGWGGLGVFDPPQQKLLNVNRLGHVGVGYYYFLIRL